MEKCVDHSRCMRHFSACEPCEKRSQLLFIWPNLGLKNQIKYLNPWLKEMFQNALFRRQVAMTSLTFFGCGSRMLGHTAIHLQPFYPFTEPLMLSISIVMSLNCMAETKYSIFSSKSCRIKCVICFHTNVNRAIERDKKMKLCFIKLY